ncbi:MAG: hypothetical protein ACYCW6_09905 [Candidatus Xenobia bacterium]
MTITRVLLCALMLAFIGTGCAAGPSVGSTGGSLSGTNLMTFTLSVNPSGVIDTAGNGYYCILFNTNGDPIEVTDLDTFTDMVRFDGFNFSWYHRQELVPAPGFLLNFIANVNDNGRLLSDGSTLQLTFNAGDQTSPFNQFLVGTRFTCHVCTTDATGGAVRGRVLDCLGPGPSLDNNSAFTVTADKILGPISPLPVGFPNDELNDFIIEPDLPPDFPYLNFDINTFDVTVQHE